MNLHFGSDRSALGPEEVERLDSLIDHIGIEHIERIALIGHADTTARRAYNERLARRRADQVKDLILQRGVPDSLVTVASTGDASPIADNRTSTGRALNRRVAIRVRSRLILPATAVQPVELPDSCAEDTLYILRNGMRVWASKCQILCCLTGMTDLTLNEIVGMGIRTITPDGVAFSVCGFNKLDLSLACDNDLVFDPPLRWELPIPSGFSSNQVEDMIAFFDSHGRWVDPKTRKSRIRIRKEHGRSYAVISTGRLDVVFSVCCAFRRDDPKVRIRYVGRNIPDSLDLYAGGSEYIGMQLQHKRRRLWVGEVPCMNRYVLAAYGSQGPNSRSYADLMNVDHRVQLLGKKCPKLETAGKRLLGFLPVKNRSLHRTYILRLKDLDLEIPRPPSE